MATNIGLGYEAQLVGQVLQARLIGAPSWITVDSPVTAAKYRLDGGGTYVRLHYIGPWSMSGVTVVGPTGNTTSSANFAANRSGSGGDWNDQSASPNILSIPALTFNPATIVAFGSESAILDSSAIVKDSGNPLGSIRITLGPGVGSLGVLSGGILTTTGTIGTISYLYESAKRLLSLTSATATGADFTQVLRLVGYNRGSTPYGSGQTICVNLGKPIYAPETGHYYEFISEALSWPTANTAANAKTFFGLTGYLANITSAAETTLINKFFGMGGWIGGTSFGSPGNALVWKWSAGPESNTVFWNGVSTGSAPAGQYVNWRNNSPGNSGQPLSTTNFEPCVIIFAEAFGTLQWVATEETDYGNVNTTGYYLEYSTATGAGNDELGGTRSIFSIISQSSDGAVIAAILQSTTAIEVSLVNGVVTSAIGVALSGITIGPSNATHIQVSIDLGTNTSGKRRQAQGFRLVGGSERELLSTRTRIGEVYNFVFLKTVDGSSSVNLLLN